MYNEKEMETLRYYLNYRCVAIYTPHKANKWTSVISSAIKLSTRVIKNIKSTCQEEEHVNKHIVMMLHEKIRLWRIKHMNICLCQTMMNWSSFNIKILAFDHSWISINIHHYHLNVQIIHQMLTSYLLLLGKKLILSNWPLHTRYSHSFKCGIL